MTIQRSEEKNMILQATRNISFELIAQSLISGQILYAGPHPNTKLYPHQKIFIIEYNQYAYIVPFVEDNDHIFLKTIYPSSKYTKIYLK